MTAAREHDKPCARAIGVLCKGPPACGCWCHVDDALAAAVARAERAEADAARERAARVAAEAARDDIAVALNLAMIAVESGERCPACHATISCGHFDGCEIVAAFGCRAAAGATKEPTP